MKFKKFIDFCFASLLILVFLALATWIIWLPIFTNAGTIANFFKKFSDDLIGRSIITVASIIMSIIVGYWGTKAVLNNYPLLTRKVGNGDFLVNGGIIQKKFLQEEIFWKWNLWKDDYFTISSIWVNIKLEFLDGLILRKIDYDLLIFPSSLIAIKQAQKNYDLVGSKGFLEQKQMIEKIITELQRNKPEIFLAFYSPFDKFQKEDFCRALKINIDPQIQEFGLQVHYPYFHPTEI